MPLVTTYLEMHSPGNLHPQHCTDPKFLVRQKTEPDWRFNRDLYFAVGANWSWTDKQPWSDQQWKEYACAPELRTFAAYQGESLAGYYELRADEDDAVEIAYFGLLPEFVGRGFGGPLLTSALVEAWRMRPKVRRVWVHTCNRDHPRALANYQARGLEIYKVVEEP
jgi:GNAT superfamily N-acetyltransferase